MKLNNEILGRTVAQINEMQNAVREAAKQIEGSSEYIEKQMKIFKESESLKHAQKLLEQQREQLANSFFGSNTAIESAMDEIRKMKIPHFEIDISTQKMIDDALKRTHKKGDE